MKKLTPYAKTYIRKQMKEGDLPTFTAVKQEIKAIKLLSKRSWQSN